MTVNLAGCHCRACTNACRTVSLYVDQLSTRIGNIEKLYFSVQAAQVVKRFTASAIKHSHALLPSKVLTLHQWHRYQCSSVAWPADVFSSPLSHNQRWDFLRPNGLVSKPPVVTDVAFSVVPVRKVGNRRCGRANAVNCQCWSGQQDLHPQQQISQVLWHIIMLSHNVFACCTSQRPVCSQFPNRTSSGVHRLARTCPLLPPVTSSFTLRKH